MLACQRRRRYLFARAWLLTPPGWSACHEAGACADPTAPTRRGVHRVLVAHVSLDRDRFPAALADELNRADQVLGSGSAVGNAWQRIRDIDGRDPSACSGQQGVCALPWPRVAPVISTTFPASALSRNVRRVDETLVSSAWVQTRFLQENRALEWRWQNRSGPGG
jgi:hypothetical protein